MPTTKPVEEKAVRKSITMPASLVSRLEKYEKSCKASDRINVSAVCSDAVDEELSKRGY